jgi:DNA-binding MarR family transcriptional regulator
MRRYDIERAVLAAPLPGPSVAIMLTLCTRIYADQGIIPPAEQPSINRLAADTGYDRSTIMRHLNDLEQDGWVIRIRPPVWLAQQLHATTAYAMKVPNGYAQASRAQQRALGALTGEARRLAHEALAARDAEARRAAASELGDGSAAASGAAAHSSDTADTRDADPAARGRCGHGVEGGALPHPKTGKPRCPMCRIEAGDV